MKTLKWNILFWSVFIVYSLIYSLTWGGTFPLNYEVNPGILQEDFESVASWTIAQSCGSTLTLNTNTQFVRSGSGSAKFTLPGGNCGITATRVVNQVFNHALFGFWFYLSPAPDGNLSTITFSFCQDAGCTIRFSKDITSANTRFFPGWNWIPVHKDDFTNTGGDDWTTSQNKMRIAVTTNGTGSGTFYIDDYYIGFYNRPKVILRLDDGGNNQATTIGDATARGIKLSICVIGSSIGDASHHSMSSLVTYKSQGHEICNHTYQHQTVGTLGDEAFWADADAMARIMEANGIGESARVLAFPQSSSSTRYDLAQKYGFVFGAGDSTLRPQPYHKGVANVYRVYLKTIGDPSVSLATAQGYVLDAIKRGELLIGLFHNFSSPDPPVSADNWSLIRTNAFFDWLNTMKDQVDVVTQKEFVDGLAVPRKKRP